MSYTIGSYTNGANSPSAWSTFTQTMGGTVYYVSNTITGNSDSNDGKSPTFTGSGHGPFTTLARASLQVFNNSTFDGSAYGGRGRYSAPDDWILLRRGDTFACGFGDIVAGFNHNNTIQNGPAGGPNSPVLVSCYDESIAVNSSTGAGVDPAASANPRPILICNSTIFAAVSQTPQLGDNIALVGLEFYPSGFDTSNTATTVPYYFGSTISGITNSGGFCQFTVASGDGNTKFWNGASITLKNIGGATSLNYTQHTVTAVATNTVTTDAAFVAGYTSGGKIYNVSTPTCIDLQYPTLFTLIEDCRFSYFGNVLNIATGGGGGGTGGYNKNVYIRRNSIYGCYVAGGASGSASAPLVNTISNVMYFDENMCDHNGWNEVTPLCGPTVFNHTCYWNEADYQTDTISGPVINRGNLIANTTSVQWRTNGTALDNTFVANHAGYNSGSPALPGGSWSMPTNDYEYNVMIDNLGDMTSDPPYNTTGMSNTVSGGYDFNTLDAYQSFNVGDHPWRMCGTINFNNNISQNCQSTTPGYVMLLGAGWSGTANNNIMYGYTTSNAAGIGTATGSLMTFSSTTLTGGVLNNVYTNLALTTVTGSGSAGFANVTVVGGVVTVSYPYFDAPNKVYYGGSGYATGDTLTASPAGGGTIHFTVGLVSNMTTSNNRWDKTPTNTYNFSLHRSLGGSAPYYKNTIGDYYAFIGNPGGYPSTTVGFLKAAIGIPGAQSAQGQSKQTWNYNLSANALNNYIRAGYDLPAYPSGVITLSPSSLPSGTVGTPYNQTIVASGGTGPYTFSSSPSPPFPGVTLTSAGVLSGTPTTQASYTFTITATDSTPTSSSPQSYNVTISAAAPPPSGTQLMGQACL